MVAFREWAINGALPATTLVAAAATACHLLRKSVSTQNALGALFAIWATAFALQFFGNAIIHPANFPREFWILIGAKSLIWMVVLPIARLFARSLWREWRSAPDFGWLVLVTTWLVCLAFLPQFVSQSPVASHDTRQTAIDYLLWFFVPVIAYTVSTPMLLKQRPGEIRDYPAAILFAILCLVWLGTARMSISV